jgi:hypothetical protein
MELIITVIAIYLVVLIAHIVVFRYSNYLHDCVDMELITPTTWCLMWPISWTFTVVYFGLYCVHKVFGLIYCTIDYFVSGQWDFTRWL